LTLSAGIFLFINSTLACYAEFIVCVRFRLHRLALAAELPGSIKSRSSPKLGFFRNDANESYWRLSADFLLIPAWIFRWA
jgi:hypothetical protein